MDLTYFNNAIDDVEAAIPLVGTAFGTLAVLALGVTLAVSWIKRIRSAV